MRRDWSQALARHAGRGCRVCGQVPAQLAHTIGRAYDRRRGKTAYVHPDSVVPLCARHHHEYDAHRFDLRPYLTEEERAWATQRVGSGQAERRLMGAAWRDMKPVDTPANERNTR